MIQGGDPTNSGSGGSSIYEDPEFETDPRDPDQKIVFGDEIHSRLRFNRRGLVGMAKGEDGRYGSQFFVTLGPAERELTGTCTMFGRVEGDGIYNVVKISEAELVEGTERPVYAVKITGCEVDELGPFEGRLKKREKVAFAGKSEDKGEVVKKKKKKPKAGKALLSFGGDEGDEDAAPVLKQPKPKFNTRLVVQGDIQRDQQKGERESANRTVAASVEQPSRAEPKHSRKRTRSPSLTQSPPVNRKPSRDPNTQLPLPDPESPRSPSPSSDSSDKPSALSRANAEIASLKASMRRNTTTTPSEPARKRSALEEMIPETSLRGRKRPAPATNGLGPNSSAQEREALAMFKAFKNRLEQAEAEATTKKPRISKTRHQGQPDTAHEEPEEEEEEEEAHLCDLHFIANCQSCKAWDTESNPPPSSTTATTNNKNKKDTHDEKAGDDDTSSINWMTHTLKFAKDTLGKDASWKAAHRDADDLVVIDPRQKEKEVVGGGKRDRDRDRDRGKKAGGGGGDSGREREKERDRERRRKMEDVGGGKTEWARRAGSGRF